MGFELDHVFIMVSVGAPEGERLRRAGLAEGPPNQHPGQGTACRRFMLRNAYVELLWVADVDAARSEVVRSTQLWDRWVARRDGSCPFGIVLRPAGSEPASPFDSWEYRPPYLPAPLAIHVARDVPLTEPAFFHLGFEAERARLAMSGVDMSLATPSLTRVTIAGPSPATSAAARSVATSGWFVAVGNTAQPVMTLTLDSGRRDRSDDLRPDLPLVLEW